MKKPYKILFLLMPAVISNSFAQSFNANSISGTAFKKSIPTVLAPTIFAIDTLVPPAWNMPCGDSGVFIYTFTSPAKGYIFGNNSYGETQCAQRYNSVIGTISEVLVQYGKKKGTTGTTSAKIYSVNPITKAPQNDLGTSEVITTASVSITNYTGYKFSSPVPVSDGFYAAVVFPTTTGDTVGILSFEFGCSSPDSLSWMNLPGSFGGWNAVSRLFKNSAPKNNTDIVILPVGDVNTSVNEYSSGGLSLLGAYPNPANDFTNISYRINEPLNVSVKVFDLTGRVLESSSEKLSAGTHTIRISSKNFPPGNYYYTIKTGSAQLTSKFVVVR